MAANITPEESKTIEEFCKIEREIRWLQDEKKQVLEDLKDAEQKCLNHIQTFMETQNQTCIPLLIQKTTPQDPNTVVQEELQYLRLMKTKYTRPINDKTLEYVQNLPPPTPEELQETYNRLEGGKNEEEKEKTIPFIRVFEEWVWNKIRQYQNTEKIQLQTTKSREKGFNKKKQKEQKPIVIQIVEPLDQSNPPEPTQSKQSVKNQTTPGNQSGQSIESGQPTLTNPPIEPSQTPTANPSGQSSQSVEPGQTTTPTNQPSQSVEPGQTTTPANPIEPVKSNQTTPGPSVIPSLVQWMNVKDRKKVVNKQVGQVIQQLHQKKEKVQPRLREFLQKCPQKRQRINIPWKENQVEKFYLSAVQPVPRKKRKAFRLRPLRITQAKTLLKKSIDQTLTTLEKPLQTICQKTFNPQETEVFVHTIQTNSFQTQWFQTFKNNILEYRRVPQGVVEQETEQGAGAEEGVEIIQLRKIR